MFRACSRALLFVSLLSPFAATAFAAHNVDGAIAESEYQFSSGNWYMDWDDQYLYVAVKNLGKLEHNGTTLASEFAVYLDPAPNMGTTPFFGSGTWGNPSFARGEGGAHGASNTLTPNLPFTANAYFNPRGNSAPGSTQAVVRVTNASGNWSTVSWSDNPDPDDFLRAYDHPNEIREMAIKWTLLGLSGRPTSFRWFGFVIGNSNSSGLTAFVTDFRPSANNDQSYYVANTSFPSNPFSVIDRDWHVTSNADSGADSLRAAIDSATADTGATRRFISFGTTGPITLNSHIAAGKSMTIDGTSHPSFDTNTNAPIVVVRASAPNIADGIEVGSGASNTTIRGLVIQNFVNGLQLAGTGAKIVGNYIGPDSGGSTATYPNTTGISVTGTGAFIGGTSSADRNVISGNNTGVFLGSTAWGTTIRGNYIGTTSSGNQGLPNVTAGVKATDTGFLTTIGGSEAGEGNVFGSNGEGIVAEGSPVNITILGNKIGVGADGLTPLGGTNGIRLNNVSLAGIGSIFSSGANIIRNHNKGVVVTGTGTGTTILGNSIYGNASMGIDLGNDGVTANDAGDGDSGPNNLQNWPDAKAEISSGTLTITYSIDMSSTSAQSIQLDLYAAPSSTIRQGQTHLARTCVNGKTFSNATWAVGSGYSSDSKFVLTATSFFTTSCGGTLDGTSEFSKVAIAHTSTATVSGSTRVGLASRPIYTATVSSTGTVTPATLTFKDNGNDITGCTNVAVSGTTAQCQPPAFSAGAHAITAVYSGNETEDANSRVKVSGSTSSALSVTVLTQKLFTGPGNFSDTAKWGNAPVPSAGESFIVAGGCTFNDANDLQYGAVTLGDNGVAGSMTWANAAYRLKVTNVAGGSGGGAIDMSGGGIFLFKGTWGGGVGLTRGTGEVQVDGGTLQSGLQFYNLTIDGPVSSPGFGIVSVYGTLRNRFASAASITDFVFIMPSGSSVQNVGGPLTFYDLLTEGTITATGSFNVSHNLQVDGTFTPAAGSVIGGTGTLSGSGTVKVTGTASPGSFGQQYTIANKTLTNLTVDYAGLASQSVDALAYGKLTISNSSGVVDAGSFTVSGVMTVNGVFTPSAGTTIGGTGTLTGTGTATVTGIAATNSFASQYTIANKTLTNLTVRYAGAAAQSIDPLGYYKLTVDNSNGATVAGTTTVSTTLTLTNGKVTVTGSLKLTNLGSGAVPFGFGYISGVLTRTIAPSAGLLITFPVGVTARTNIGFQNTGSSIPTADVSVAAFANADSNLGGSGLDPSRNLNVYYSVAVDGNPDGMFEVDVAHLNNAALIDAGATYTRFSLRRRDPSNAWSDVTLAPGTHQIGSDPISAWTGTSYFFAGEQLLHHFDVSASSPQAALTPFTTTVTARDELGERLTFDDTTQVTMSGSSASVFFDANGDATFDDHSKPLTAGQFTIPTRITAAGTYTLSAQAGAVTGTSSQITVDDAITVALTTTFASGPAAFIPGQFTATLTPNPSGSATGTVKFTDNGADISGCEAVTVASNAATCNVTFTTEGSHSIVATYQGDGTYPQASSSSLTRFVPKTLNGGNGNLFSVASNWSSGTLPVINQDFTVIGTAVYDSNAPSLAYDSIQLGNSGVPGTIQWTSAHSLPLRVGFIVSNQAGSGIDMSGGGVLEIERLEPANLTFNAGTGKVRQLGFIVAPFTYYDLNIATNLGGDSSVTVTVLHDFTVEAGAGFSPGSGTVTMSGSGGTIRNNGTGLTFKDLTITGTTTAATSFSAAAGMSVSSGGTFTPLENAVITGGSLNCEGECVVTSIAASNGFTSQYLFEMTPPLQNVAFRGASAQSIDARAYGKLTVDNSSGATVAGTTTVSNALTLTSGQVTVTGSLKVTSVSGVVTWGTGYVSGVLTRMVEPLANSFFPVGAGAFGTVNFSNQGSSLSVVEVSVGAFGNADSNLSGSGLDPSQNLNVYYTVAVAGSPGGTFQMVITHHNNPAVIDAAATSFTFALRRRDAGGLWSDATSTVGPTSIGSGLISAWSGTSTFVVGEQLLDHFDVAAASPQTASTAFTTTVTARDALGVQMTSGAVTMSGSAAGVLFNFNGNGTFGENGDDTIPAINGSSTISTRIDAAGTFTITAQSGNVASTSSAITVIASAGAPSNVVATMTSTSSITITWSAVSGATSYKVWRSSLGSAFAPLAGDPASPVMIDSGLTAGRTYVYKVQAFGASGGSGLSAPDAATTIVFTDASLSGVKAKAIHLTELRTAVDAMRAAAGLGAATFTDNSLSGVAIKRTHFIELRTALDAARASLSLPALAYTDPAITAGTTTVKAAHVTELRAGTQ